MTSAVTGRHSNQLNYRAVHFRRLRRPLCFSDIYYYNEQLPKCQDLFSIFIRFFVCLQILVDFREVDNRYRIFRENATVVDILEIFDELFTGVNVRILMAEVG